MGQLLCPRHAQFSICVCVCVYVSVCVCMSTICVRNSFNGFFWYAFDSRILLSLIRSGEMRILFGQFPERILEIHAPLWTQTFFAFRMGMWTIYSRELSWFISELVRFFGIEWCLRNLQIVFLCRIWANSFFSEQTPWQGFKVKGGKLEDIKVVFLRKMTK